VQRRCSRVLDDALSNSRAWIPERPSVELRHLRSCVDAINGRRLAAFANRVAASAIKLMRSEVPRCIGIECRLVSVISNGFGSKIKRGGV
jgi:hypothetical protein